MVHSLSLVVVILRPLQLPLVLKKVILVSYQLVVALH
jgi:hypothetical protein